MVTFESFNKPNSLVGVGLRHLHYNEALDQENLLNRDVDFVEIHAENFFVEGGIKRHLLDEVCNSYQLSVHGTSLGLGSLLPLPSSTLNQFSDIIEHTNPAFVSEHLCFNRAKVEDKIIHTGDLLPLAFTSKTLDALCFNVDAVQRKIKRPILLENLSAYLDLSSVESKNKSNLNDVIDEYSELEFVHMLCEQTGCGLLVDINNMIVNEINKINRFDAKHETQQTEAFNAIVKHLKQIDPKYVGEIHLAGYSDQQVEGFVVDDHARPVSELCWRIYEQALNHFGQVATLVEWDNDLPFWSQLVDEAQKARAIMNKQSTSIPIS